MTKRSKRMLKAEVEALFEHLSSMVPQPKTELNYTSDFELLTSVLLSAQATDVSVNKACAKLYAVANTPQAILDLGLEKLESYISSIGLYHSKAKHLIRTSEILVTQHQGRVPNTRQALELLPGVGRKTANVVLNILFNEPTLAVDTHIFRVSNRMGLAFGKTPLEVEQGLLKVIPNPYLLHAHHWLILHGRYTCTARKPKCHLCSVSQYCHWLEKPIL